MVETVSNSILSQIISHSFQNSSVPHEALPRILFGDDSRLYLFLVNMVRALCQVSIYGYVRVVVAYDYEFQELKGHMISKLKSSDVDLQVDEEGSKILNMCKNVIDMCNGTVSMIQDNHDKVSSIISFSIQMR